MSEIVIHRVDVFPAQCENIQSAKMLLSVRQGNPDTFLVLRGTDGAIRRMSLQMLIAQNYHGRLAPSTEQHPARSTHTFAVRGVAVRESGKDKAVVLFDRQEAYKKGDQLPC